MYPCQETYCSNGMCFCEGPSIGACIPDPNSIDECDEPLGYCHDGVCKPANRDEGCPCHTCESPAMGACLNTDQPCKCKSGECLPNYLPKNTACDADEAGLTLEVCEVALCRKNGHCEASVGPLLSACYATNIPSCENAGQCAILGGNVVCDLLNCVIPPADIRCQTQLEGQPCDIAGGLPGTCCLEVDGGTLQCNTDVGNSGFCPCVTSGATTCEYEDSEMRGYCCLLTGGNFECVSTPDSCSEPSFCQIVTGLDNVGCSPSSSCGTGNSDCNDICSQLQPEPACVGIANSCSCSATGVPGISSVDCDEASPRKQKCCTCDST